MKAANVAAPDWPDMMFSNDNRFMVGPIVESDNRTKKFAVFSRISQASIAVSYTHLTLPTTP